MIRTHPAGKIQAATVALALSLLLVGGLLAVLIWPRLRNSDARVDAAELMVFCAPALKAPLESISHDYEALTGTRIRLQFSPSQTILTSAELAHRGDLFVPADDSYTDVARKKDLIDETIPLLRMRAVIVVKKGNPLKISSLSDLSREGIRTVLAGDAAAVGALTHQALQSNGMWDTLAKKAVFVGSVSEAASAVTISADAAIIWSAMLPQFPALQAVEDPQLDVHSRVSISVLHASTQSAAALRFARFVAARDKGLAAFAAGGYEVEEGDAWQAAPELKLFAGAMLRPAIEPTLAEFETREGVKITRVYNGCGILVAQMRASGGASLPDGYFSCDTSFMNQVADLYPDPVTVSTNQLVILVPKGNPLQIKDLKDLSRPGLKIGIGHEKQCALGALTAVTFKTGGVWESALKNVKVQAASGDMLVNQLLTGSLDAVVAYISNAAGESAKLEAIAIDIPCAKATQPLAVAKNSPHKRLAQRLLAALTSAASKKRFESMGFGWTARE